MISGELLKYRKGFRIHRSYEQRPLASSQFGLTTPFENFEKQRRLAISVSEFCSAVGMDRAMIDDVPTCEINARF